MDQGDLEVFFGVGAALGNGREMVLKSHFKMNFSAKKNRIFSQRYPGFKTDMTNSGSQIRGGGAELDEKPQFRTINQILNAPCITSRSSLYSPNSPLDL